MPVYYATEHTRRQHMRASIYAWMESKYVGFRLCKCSQSTEILSKRLKRVAFIDIYKDTSGMCPSLRLINAMQTHISAHNAAFGAACLQKEGVDRNQKEQKGGSQTTLAL